MTYIIIGICIITAMIAIIYITRGSIAKCEQFIVAEKPKPITTKNAWIFYPYQKNARVWADYGSRLQYQPRSALFEKTYTELSGALTTHGWTLHILDQYTIPLYLEDIPLDLIGENATVLVLGRYCGDCGSNNVSFMSRLVLAAVFMVRAAIILSIKHDSFLENTGGFDIEFLNILTD